MTYNAIAAAAQDADLRLRVAACFAQEAADSPHHPTTLAEMHMWAIAARADISDAYSYAVALGTIERPGKDEAVVTDANILAAVQAITGAE